MSILSREEFMQSVKTIVGDRTDDEALKFIEDCNDTITDDKEQWRAKYEAEVESKKELDESWRTKFKERFYSSDTNITTQTQPQPQNNDPFDTRTEEQKQAERVSIDDLFN